MLNTDKKGKIESKNIYGKRIVVGGSIVTALMLALTLGPSAEIVKKDSNEFNKETTTSVDSPYNIYSSAYLKALSQMDYSEFDDNFISLYREGKYLINGNNYDINEIYLVKLETGIYHLIKAGNNSTDILTGESFNGPIKMLFCFRESSMFYSMYMDGFASDGTIIIDESIFNEYIQKWDGLKHASVPELKADGVANKEALSR